MRIATWAIDDFYPQYYTDFMNNPALKQIAVIASLGMTLTLNALATLLPINNLSTGEISDMFPVRFTPAGYVFSIWSVIYLGLIIYAIYQALPAQRNNPRLQSVAWPFVLSNIANSLWILAWHYLQITLSLMIMLLLFATLLHIYHHLGTGRFAVERKEALAVRVPFSIYLGWITVATVANTTITLYNLGWQQGAAFWASVAIIVGLVVGLMVLRRRQDIAYTAVLVWAFIGIAVAQWSSQLVAWTALGAATILLVMIILQLPNRTEPQAVIRT
jgi:translocator protein